MQEKYQQTKKVIIKEILNKQKTKQKKTFK